jgi:hypothetical protein
MKREERERKRESKREREKERERARERERKRERKKRVDHRDNKKSYKTRGNVISFYEQLALPLPHMLDEFSLKMTGRKRRVESWEVDSGRS